LAPNVLRFGLEPEGLTMELTGIGPNGHTMTPMTVAEGLEPSELPAHGRLLLDVLEGDAALSIRGDEAEESWRLVEPVIEAWAKDLVPLEEYPAGSSGPAGHDGRRDNDRRDNDRRANREGRQR
jgi:glucose-6-phosphate 1-dehydrogenase